MEGAKFIRNITLVGAFWTGVVLLVTNANAEPSIYESEGVKSVTVSPGMRPGVVPQAEINVEAGGASTDSGNAAQGGVQVQNVTVQAGAESTNKNTNSSASEAINKARNDAEVSNNALLLQQIELDRLKAEQKRIKAIQEFGSNLEKPECEGSACQLPAHNHPGPCGTSPCTPQQAPVIENNIYNDSVIKGASVDQVEEVEESSSSLFSNVKWGLSPVVGYRWYDEGSGPHKAKVTNKYYFGGALTADFNKWFSTEGSFTYGQDKLEGYSKINGHGYWRTSNRNSYEFAITSKIGKTFNSFRPYALFGMSYLMQDYEFDNKNETSHNGFGSVGGGLDYAFNKNFSIGARGDYQFGLIKGSTKKIDGIYTLNDIYGDFNGRYRMGATASYTF